MTVPSVPAATNWEDFRRQMPVTEHWAYFDHAAVAPLPGPTRLAIRRWLDEASEQGDTIWGDWSKRREQVRHVAASMINADDDEIAFVGSTTAGISVVAEGLALRPGDNIVTLSNEFPSNLYPWMNQQHRGVTTKLVQVDDGQVDLQRVADACDDRTRLVSLSWVGFVSGWRIDVAAAAKLAHEQGALFFLDAIQGLGVYPIDVRATEVDFFAADGHKWLLAPERRGCCTYVVTCWSNSSRLAWAGIASSTVETTTRLTSRCDLRPPVTRAVRRIWWGFTASGPVSIYSAASASNPRRRRSPSASSSYRTTRVSSSIVLERNCDRRGFPGMNRASLCSTCRGPRRR